MVLCSTEKYWSSTFVVRSSTGVVLCSTFVVRSSSGVVLCSREQYWMDVVLTSFWSE